MNKLEIEDLEVVLRKKQQIIQDQHEKKRTISKLGKKKS